MQSFMFFALAVVLALAVALALNACGKAEAPPGPTAAGPITATNYPIAFFAERILGEQVPVVLPMPAEGDPAFWQPTAEEVQALQESRLILLNGAGYEQWLPAVSLSSSLLVDTTRAFATDLLHRDAGQMHQHGDGEAHSHSGPAFTTWLDFGQAAQQAQAIAEALQQQWPEQAPLLAERLQLLQAELQQLHQQMQEVAKPLQEQVLLASHPVYDYLARAYDLQIESVLWEPEVMPEADAWRDLADLRFIHSAKVMLYEGEPLPEIRQRLVAEGLRVVVFDPCGNRPATGDFFSIMRQNIAALATVAE